MNLQLIPNEPSPSKEIFWDVNTEPSLKDKAKFYKKKLGHWSTHDHIILRPNKRTQRSDLYNDFHKKIIELSRLEKGWDSYTADPPDYKALKKALAVLNRLFDLNFIPTSIMPCVDGGISFLFVRPIKYADIECDNDGDILAGMSDRTGEPILWTVGKIYNLDETIKRIRLFLHN